MAQKLTDTIVDALPAPEKGNRITVDTEVKGFGIRVTAAGARSFVLNYRTRAGRERRYTIGSRPEWKTSVARKEAEELKVRIKRGDDPMAEIEADRNAKTVADLCSDYIDKHLPKKRPTSALDDGAMIRLYIEPGLGKHRKVADVNFSDIDALHRKLTKAGKPIRANRVVALLSKMFNLAMRWQWRPDNPCKGIERNPEEKRHRYLSPAEMARLTAALATHEDQQASNIVRLLLLTGARRGEVLAMQWEHLDVTSGIWVKPGSTTKQKTLHRVPLSAPARQLLADLRAKAVADEKATGREMSDYVFPGRGGKGYRQEIKKNWRELCEAAELEGVRIHDLRHSFASVLASAGLSLPVIGALLGHSQPATTARYAHLMDDPLRQATERVGAIVMPSQAEGAEIVQMPTKGGAA